MRNKDMQEQDVYEIKTYNGKLYYFDGKKNSPLFNAPEELLMYQCKKKKSIINWILSKDFPIDKVLKTLISCTVIILFLCIIVSIIDNSNNNNNINKYAAMATLTPLVLPEITPSVKPTVSIEPTISTEPIVLETKNEVTPTPIITEVPTIQETAVPEEIILEPIIEEVEEEPVEENMDGFEEPAPEDFQEATIDEENSDEVQENEN